MPPSKFPTNSNSVANHPSHCVWIGQQFTWWQGSKFELDGHI
jgi:hypothetical protein